MDELTRKQLFEQAKKKRDKEKEEQAAKGAYSGEYESIAYCALSTEYDRVVRLLGLPIACRQSPSDAKLSYIGMLKADDGKKTRIIFPDHQTNKDWILWKIIDLVLDGKMVGSGDSRHREYTYETVHPECFRRVRWNDNESNSFESGWYPTSFVNINCIDRSDMSWHKENKHTKLLSKRASKIGDTDNFYFDTGIPLACYNAIFDNVVEPFGDWEEYDVVIRKMSSSPWYTALSGTHDFARLSDVVKTIIIDGPLSEEEKSWERYDLDQLYGVTSYSKIKAKLGKFIQKVDVDFGKHFTEELDSLVAKEKAEWEAKKPKQTESAPAPAVSASSEEDDGLYMVPPAPEAKPTVLNVESLNASSEIPSRPVKEEIPTRTPRAVEIDWVGLANGTYNGTKYLGVPLMTDEEKDFVLGVQDDGQFIYRKKEGVVLFKSTKTEFNAPDFFHVDPLDGTIF